MRRRKTILKRTAAAVLAAVALFFILDLVFPLRPEVEYAPLVKARDGMVLHTFLTRDEQWRMQTDLKEITPELTKAIIFKEDRYFYYHCGVNPFAVGRAFINNLFRLKRTSGASTIDMQVARMLHPGRRSYANKVLEMFRALQLELHYSKAEILRMYLNLVPYGSNIQGVKAASLLYLDKSPDQLSLAEITALSIIPNRPNSLVIGRDNRYITLERNKWLRRFDRAGLFPHKLIEDALNEPLRAYRHNAPRLAPQFSWRMRRQYAGLNEIRTTLDFGIQRKAEDLVTGYMNSLRLRGIFNAAVLVADNRTHEVVSYIGSPDYADREHHGQVDGVAAMRSPGSTLKPLLYGLCMDRGFITPKTVIADVPVSFNGYSPENYDLAFHGNITVEDALQRSLNIPAVKLLDKEGVKQFAGVLSEAGFASVWQNRKRLGLSMILGGCGVRLEELTSLYSSFSTEGEHYSLRWLLKDSAQHGSTHQKGLPILSPAASYLVTNILMELHRPDLPNLYDQARNIPRIAWKTGTSYGRKDAWSIGYNQRYTIGVWIGNFSGKGVAELNGAMTATPLLFDLFNSIDARAGEEWLKEPPSVGFRLVCAETGKLPNDYCENQVMDQYIPGISSNERCDHLQQVWLSADEKISYCTACLPAAGYKTKNYPRLSSEMIAYYENGHIPYQKIPPHNPECSRLFDGEAPVINSLTNDMTYIIMDKGQQNLQLSCAAANDVQKVYWYINDRFFSAAGSGEKLFFNPESPEIRISCTDDKGRSSQINIKVKFI